LLNIFHIRADDLAEGMRLDVFLASQFSQFSRSKIQKLIKDKKLFVNKELSVAAYKLREGDEISFEEPEEESLEPVAEKIPLEIVVEEKDFLILNKQAGMVVHPAVGNARGTLLNAILGYLGENLVTRGGIVHRLDKDTSGLILVAKNEAAFDFFQNQFKDRKVVKKYLALVWGKLPSQKGIIEAPISRSKKDRKKMDVSSDGRKATTNFKVIKEYQFQQKQTFSLLEIEPKTGRTHQIRVHLKALGHPVVGDFTYGKRNELDKILGRHFLHAFYLKFKTLDNKDREFKIDLSSKLKSFLTDDLAEAL